MSVFTNKELADNYLKINPKLSSTYKLKVSQEYLDLLEKMYVETDKLQYEIFGDPNGKNQSTQIGSTPNNKLLCLLDGLWNVIFSFTHNNDIGQVSKDLLQKYYGSPDLQFVEFVPIDGHKFDLENGDSVAVVQN